MSSAAAVRVTVPDGTALRCALRAVHFGAALLAVVAGGWTLPGLLLAAAILGHLYWFEARRRALSRALRAVLFDGAGFWYLQWRDGRREPARLAPGTVISPWLTILTLEGASGRIGLFITPDMLDAESFRRLRVRLLWQSAAAAGAV